MTEKFENKGKAITLMETASAMVPDFRRLLMMVAMTAVMASKAWAGDITPKYESLVTADVVTVGDVFDGVTHSAAHVLAPAPGLGEELKLSAHDLKRIADAFGYNWQPQSNMDQVVIRRDAVEIDRYQIEAALQEKLSRTLPGRRFELALDTSSRRFYVPPTETAALDVLDMATDINRAQFRATVAAGETQRLVTGQFYLVTEVPVLQNPVRSGDIISKSDVTYVDIREKDISSKTVLDAGQLIGKSARRSLPALRTISAADVTEPLLVKKGDLITLTLQNSTLHLTAQGKALENGTAGGTVRVMNTSSNQVLEGVVTGAQNVAIGLPGSG
jgi:flagella basal body P-ring formation protein FlgA